MVVDTKLYDILGVKPDVSERDLKKAFMRKAREVHPDKNQDDPDATEKFQAVNEAYEILKDPSKREKYDKFGIEGLRENEGADFDDILSHLFGFHPDDTKPRTRDIVEKVNISLEDSYNGVEKKINITRHVVCPKCQGKGTKDGKEGRKCKDCNGQGQVIMSNGLFQSIEECPKCHGQGEFIDEDDQCEQCHGDHLIEEPKEIDIRIERGAEQGDRIVFQGAADEIPDFDTGDVVIVIKEEDHERFQRNHHHLLYKKTLSLTEALYGATFVIEHLDGRKLLVNTNTQETINPGTVQIIENEGMPMKGDSFKKGKLFIEYEIEFPSKEELTPEFQKELFKIIPPVDETKGIDLESENVHKVEPQEGSIEEFESAKKAKKEARREAYRSDDDDDGDNDEGYDGDEDDYDEDDGQGGPGCQPM